MIRKIKFANNYYYHVYNRGVEKRLIFLDEEDYQRFIYYLYELNNKDLVSDIPFFKRQKIGDLVSDRNKLVDIVCFVLMPNHFHLLLRQAQENGIRLFLHKLSLAYARYFNEKYERVGSLFQGRFKAKLVDRNEYINYLFYYILMNPLELIEPKWKDGKIKNPQKLKNFLKSYKWSSHGYYKDEINFPFVVNKKAILNLFETLGDLDKFFEEILAKNSLSEFQSLTLEQ